MQDLLNEEELIREKPYNPWKSFKIFYAVAVLQTLILIGLKWFALLEGYTMFYLFYMMFPPITAILMFRFPMKNIEVPRKTKLLGILGLTGCYFSTTLVLFICLVFYQYNGLLEVIRFALPLLCFMSIIVYILCSFAVLVFSYFWNTKKYG